MRPGELPYVVADGDTLEPDGTIKILGRFQTEEEAAEYIGTLPGHLDGRYSLDGPADDYPDLLTPDGLCRCCAQNGCECLEGVHNNHAQVWRQIARAQDVQAQERRSRMGQDADVIEIAAHIAYSMAMQFPERTDAEIHQAVFGLIEDLSKL